MPKPPPPPEPLRPVIASRKINEKQTRQFAADWQELKESIRLLVAQEKALRARIVADAFPVLKEGVNRLVLSGVEIVVNHTINRAVDEAILSDAKFSARLKALKISADELVRFKPELNLRPYRKLTKEQLQIFDGALIIKDGANELEIL